MLVISERKSKSKREKRKKKIPSLNIDVKKELYYTILEHYWNHDYVAEFDHAS